MTFYNTSQDICNNFGSTDDYSCEERLYDVKSTLDIMGNIMLKRNKMNPKQLQEMIDHLNTLKLVLDF